MTIDEKIQVATAYRDTLAKQIKAIAEESAGLQQRYNVLLATYTREEGRLAALEEVKAEMDKEPQGEVT